MSTITHALIGGILSFLIYLNSNNLNAKKRFSKAHVIIFTINSFIGPDIGKIAAAFGPYNYVVNDIIHNIFGWFVFSIPFTFLYFYIFNGVRPLNSPKSISFKSIYLLILGAGIFHYGYDLLDQSVRLFPKLDIFPDWTISLETFKTGLSMPTGILSYLLPDFGFTELFIISMFFLVIIIWSFYKKPLKTTIIIAIIYLTIIIALLYLLGSNIVHGENDFGLLFYGIIFWGFPIALMFLSFESSPEQKKSS